MPSCQFYILFLCQEAAWVLKDLLPPSGLCRCSLPADSNAKTVCYSNTRPAPLSSSLWDLPVVCGNTLQSDILLAVISKYRFANASHLIFSCEALGQSPWTNSNLVLPATHKGLQSTRSHSLKERKLYEM